MKQQKQKVEGLWSSRNNEESLESLTVTMGQKTEASELQEKNCGHEL